MFADRVEIARLWVTLALVDARLTALPWALNRAWVLRPYRATPSPGPHTQVWVDRLVGLLLRASRFRWRRTAPCLVLSLALRERLAGGGVGSALVFGARRASLGKRGLETHARLRLGAVLVDATAPGEAFHDFTSVGAVLP